MLFLVNPQFVSLVVVGLITHVRRLRGYDLDEYQ